MVASVQELLDHMAALSSTAGPDAASASAAVRALEPVGRALGVLRQVRVDATGRDVDDPALWRRVLVCGELAAACRTAAAQWPPSEGGLVDVAGALGDLISIRAVAARAEERWAASCALAETAGRLVQVATRFAPYISVPALQRVARLSALHEQAATFDPPVATGLSWLETTIAPAVVHIDQPGTGEPAGLAAALSAALQREDRADTLTVYGALAAAAAAEAWTQHAIGVMRTRDGEPTTSAPYRHSPDGWRVVQAALIRFDDGSRLCAGSPSATIAHALALHQALPSSDVPQEPASGAQAESVASARVVVNQLPELARRIEAALARWGSSGRLFARARNLPRREEHVAAILRDRVVVAEPLDMYPVLTSTKVAARLTAALAVELDRTCGGRDQPQPSPVRALAAHSCATRLDRDAQWASRLAARWDSMPRAGSPAR